MTSRLHRPWARLSSERLEERAVPATFVVDTLLDAVNASDGVTSLREAINLANANPDDPDTITANLTGTILLTVGGVEDANAGGDLDIRGSVSIRGPGADKLTVNANGLDRVFDVQAPAGYFITITGLTITGGSAGGPGGNAAGGGVFNLASELVLARVAIVGNHADNGGAGGGISSNGGTLNISDSTIAGNTATNVGGLTVGGGRLILSNSTVSGNIANNFSGGINTGADRVDIRNSTITANNGGGGTGGYNIFPGSAIVTLLSTIVAGNIGAGSQDVGGTLQTTSANNLIGNSTGMTGISNGTNGNLIGNAGSPINPLLGPLQNNGGPTRTHALQAGSPAIDHGGFLGFNTSDQRGSGFPRVVNGTVDIGAFEVQLPIPLAASGTVNGSAVLFTPGASGQFASSPAATLSPFGAIPANVRTAVADVNGDGTPDTILITGPGTPFRFVVVSGVDNTTLLIPVTAPFVGSEDFLGGGFVSAADLDGDGRAEIVITPDQGGGPRVTIFSLVGSTPIVRVNFFGIDDPNFRGGARSALGDINRDGKPDLLVAAGFGGGPRVSLFDGTTLLSSRTKLRNDFFAFPEDAVTLRNGIFAALGDITGDGFADLIFGGGPGGSPRVFILSGAFLTSSSPNLFSQPVANFFVAGNSNDRGGVRVAVKNADGDARADLAVGSGEGSPANVRVYRGLNFITNGEPGTFQDLSVFGGVALTDGVFVG